MSAIRRGKEPAKASKRKPQRVPTAASLNRRMRHTEKKRSAILEAALATFSQYGLHGASIDQIASRADVSKTNLFYYFSNKEELYTSVLSYLLDLWLQPLIAFTEEQDPIDAIRDYIRVKLEFSRDHPAESRLFCMEVMQGAPLLLNQLQQPLHDLVENKVTVIRSWIEQGRLAPIEPYHLIFSLWATTQHYADFRVQVEAVAGRTLDDPDFFQETLTSLEKLVLDGVRPRN
ncbi:TetR family transcriptional regulator [Marinobacter salarius]|uniref:TetR family transcriptional regulator n=1 Tax=Marinobacter salarius TaxID=1420917 RepID=W5YS06_9GAMM|nr:TetR family transcriptional regulator [Marinobacter salarius]